MIRFHTSNYNFTKSLVVVQMYSSRPYKYHGENKLNFDEMIMISALH